MRPTLILAFLVFFAAPLVADESSVAEYVRVSQEAVEAVRAGRFDEGRKGFQRCHEMFPDIVAPAYNLACVSALEKANDDAFTWLSKAVDLGWSDVDFMRQDPDLEGLRPDERFAALVQRIERRGKVGKEYASAPAVYVPDSAPAEGPLGLLIVLHDFGETKDDVVAGPWREVAEDLGVALLAPSGEFLSPTSAKPEDGMDWWLDFKQYTDRPWVTERKVEQAFSTFKKEREVDPARVVLAGSGRAGIVAFGLAVGAPGQYTGVVVLDGLVTPVLVGEKAPNAARLGLGARVLFHRGVGPPRGLGPFERRDVVELARTSLSTWRMRGGVDESEQGAPSVESLVAAVRSLDRSTDPKKE